LLKSDFDTRIPAGHAAVFNSSSYTGFGYTSARIAVHDVERPVAVDLNDRLAFRDQVVVIIPGKEMEATRS
jgi:hypothetical protein